MEQEVTQALPTIEEIKRRKQLTNKRLRSVIKLPRTVHFIACLIFGSIPILAIFLLLAPWQQVSMGKGTVIAYAPKNRRQALEAPISGRIAKWYVQEGVKVKKGDPLVALSDIDPDIIMRLKQQRDALRINLNAAEQAYELSKKNLERQKLLAQDGLSSERDFELAQIETANFQSALSKVRGDLASMEVKLSRQQSQTVRAEQAGVVMRILAPQGGIMVSAGEELATLVPDTNDKAVELYISGNDLPLIEPGRKARLQFEGWPAVQFTGWPSVAIGTFGGEVRYIDHADDGNGNYRVLIFPDPADHKWPNKEFLRQGVRTVGWILLEEVSLGWELWRKLNGFPVTVSKSVEEKMK